MSDRLRIDKWLWFARFSKTRSRAQTLIAKGCVFLNDHKVRKTKQTVSKGDIISIVYGSVKRTVTVAATGTHRGPAAEARLLYEKDSRTDSLNKEKCAGPHFRLAGSRRPTKRDRRLLEKLFLQSGSD